MMSAFICEKFITKIQKMGIQISFDNYMPKLLGVYQLFFQFFYDGFAYTLRRLRILSCDKATINIYFIQPFSRYQAIVSFKVSAKGRKLAPNSRALFSWLNRVQSYSSSMPFTLARLSRIGFLVRK